MKVKFFCKDNPSVFNEKPLHEAYPRPERGAHDVAIEWASCGGRTHVVFDTTNHFDEVYILPMHSSRTGSAKVLKAAIYLKDHDVYVMVDFRVEGMLDTISECNIMKGKIVSSMGFIFKSGGYYLFRKHSAEFKEYIAKQSTPKESPPKMELIKGASYVLSNDTEPSLYLGQVTATYGSRHNGNYIGGKVYHAFQRIRRYCVIGRLRGMEEKHEHILSLRVGIPVCSMHSEGDGTIPTGELIGCGYIGSRPLDGRGDIKLNLNDRTVTVVK